MSAPDLAFAPVDEIARRVAAGEVTARAVTEGSLGRIAGLDGRINAFAAVLAAPALEQADAIDAARRRGATLGPLAGVPVAVKDLVDVAGVPTTAGAHPLFHVVPGRDATLVARIRAAGGIVVGKTRLHEFAYGVSNVNLHHGPTRNPWRLDLIPGGSSGGSAAAVAAGLCAAAVGTDTGGSIRIPAALCGVVGLKPTFGAVPLDGVLPLGWSLDHAGPIARSVDDAERLYRVMAGIGDRAIPDEGPPRGDDPGRPLAGVRVGIPRTWFWERLDAAVSARAEEALETLRALGAGLEEIEIPHASFAGGTSAIILAVEAMAVHEERLKTHPEAFGPETRARLDRGFFVPGAALLRAQRARAFLTREMDRALASVEVVVMPTTVMPASPIAEAEAAARGEAPSLSLPLTRNTNPFNLNGSPAVSLPCGFTADGLPVGLQVAGRRGGEAGVMRVARSYEAATAWHHRRPPLAASGFSPPGTRRA